MLTTERINFQEVSILSSGLCLLSRLPGAAISSGNYGSFQDPDQLIIPSSNVGTVLTFPHVIKDYLYVDITVVGGIAGVSVFSPGASFGFVGGIKAVVNGRYVIRLPYVGAIESLLFDLKDYRVVSIVVGYTTDNVLETRDDAIFVVAPTAGWIDQGGNVAATVAPGATIRGTTVVGTPVANTFGKLWIETYKPLYGLPTIIPGVTFYDGDSCFSYFTFTPFVMIFRPFPITNNAWVEFTNTSTEDVVLKIYTRILSFKNLSTVYGNN